MVHIPAVCAVCFVADVQRIRDFYRTVIGMAIVTDESNYAILAIPGFELVIHGIPNEPAPELLPSGLPRVREDCYLKICLPVESIEDARSRATRLGGLIKDVGHEWSARGFRACDGYDPEGNVFQVRQPSPK